MCRERPWRAYDFIDTQRVCSQADADGKLRPLGISGSLDKTLKLWVVSGL